MSAVLLDRDGVVLVNKPFNIKSPAQLEFVPEALEIADASSHSFRSVTVIVIGEHQGVVHHAAMKGSSSFSRAATPWQTGCR